MRPLALCLGVAAVASACTEPCCTFESLPVPIERAAAGELLARISEDGAGGDGELAVIDTGAPFSLWDAGTRAGQVDQRRFRLLASGSGATRGLFRGIATLSTTLGPVGTAAAPIHPRALLGGAFLSRFSLEIGFGSEARPPALTFWNRQPAGDGFLSAWGYAVIHVDRVGGGELEARAPGAAEGPARTYEYPPSLLVFRACAAPAPFDRDAPVPVCERGQERALSTGVDLQLLLGTGVGPLVLGSTAWARVRERLGDVPAPVPGQLLVATAAAPIEAMLTSIPRLALVDREASALENPGPCVELGRARRLEQIAVRQAANPEIAPCVLPCDEDPAEDQPRARNSAGYVELGGRLPVAVVADDTPFLQTLRQEVRPEGPEIDGVIGAGALREARVELDYRSQPARAIFSCEPGASAERCRAVGRCPRLPGCGQQHACFGLPPHGLPQMCENRSATCGS